MKTVQSKDFNRLAGPLMQEVAEGETIVITYHRAPRIVMLSMTEYRRLTDAWWERHSEKSVAD